MDQYVLELVLLFHANPLHFFHEKENQSAFFAIGRERSGTAQTADHLTIHLFREDYNTLWRYRRRGPDGFAERFHGAGEGDVGEIDFVLLRRDFVQRYSYLTVMNKEEAIRRTIRPNPFPENESSPMIERGLEFKMAHVHRVGPRPYAQAVRLSDFDREGIILDCRKLACERVRVGYSVAFTHATHLRWFGVDYITALFNDCLQEWNQCYDVRYEPASRLRLLIVSPIQCFRWGDWEVDLPNEFHIPLTDV